MTKSLVSVICLSVICLSACQDIRREPKKPNVLFISIDDLRPEIGCYGNDHIKTPNIDQFATEGVIFTRAYCQSAVCAPSRASLMTGLRPDSTHVWHLGDEFRKIKPDAVTMPQYFHKHGYYTVSIGKIFHNYMPDSVSWDEPDLRPYPYGESEHLLRDGETFYVNAESQAIQKRRRDSILAIRPVKYADGWNCGPGIEIGICEDDQYIDGAQADLAIETLKRLKNLNQPFYLALGFYRPHLPFAAPQKYWDMYDRKDVPMPGNSSPPQGSPSFTMNSMYELRSYAGFTESPHPVDAKLPDETLRLLKHGYMASVSYVDACVGKVLDALEDLGLDKNTIVTIWGDHGWKLGDLGSWGKMTNYEIDIRVPLMIKAQGSRLKAQGSRLKAQGSRLKAQGSRLKAQGVRCDGLVELVDIFPTLCELADIEIEDYLHGRSIVPLMENPGTPWKKAAFTQFHRRPKVAHDGGRYMGYSMITNHYHLIEWFSWDNEEKISREYKATELFDLESDPFEKVNIVNLVDEKLLTSLRKQLASQFSLKSFDQ